ncbi:MAG: glycosyltransferase family 2 protein [Cognatishimia sp.]|uniref:glycosyltransferase family 2 protein n=1 Tax=Cognatishimia sp. TaxID=2211648 RepID=UPI003B8E862D
MTWDIVLTADEPEALIVANVAYHLATGAQHVHVYLDRADDPAQEALKSIPGARVTCCDEKHWSDLNGVEGRPALQMRRQSLNANHALSLSNADWIFSLDADEFLYQDRPLVDELPFVRELDCELHLPTWERFYREGEPVQTLFQGPLKASTKGRHRFDGRIFGGAEKYFVQGLLGHSAGKCAVPVGADFVFGLHWSFRGQAKRQYRSERYLSTTSRLLHFDGLTPLHWVIKLLRYAKVSPEDLGRLVSDHRREQISDLLNFADSRDSAMEFHDALRAFSELDMKRLNGFGLLDADEFDPLPEVQKLLPDFNLPGPDAFDAEILDRYPEFKPVFSAKE